MGNLIKIFQIGRNHANRVYDLSSAMIENANKDDPRLRVTNSEIASQRIGREENRMEDLALCLGYCTRPLKALKTARNLIRYRFDF